MRECYARAPHTSTLYTESQPAIHPASQRYNTHRISQLFCIGIGLHKNVCATGDTNERVFRKCAYSKRLLAICHRRRRCQQTTIRYQQVKRKSINISMDTPSLSFIFEETFHVLLLFRCVFRLIRIEFSMTEIQFALSIPRANSVRIAGQHIDKGIDI